MEYMNYQESFENIEIIIEELEKSINYEIKKGKFVIFGRNNYFNIIKNLISKKYFKKLLLIKKLFLLEEEDYNSYYNNCILDIAKELVKKEELKNNDRYDLIEVNDIFIMNREGDYPMEIFKEFNLNNIEDDFYEK